MANPNWTRWVHGSIGKYLKDIATSNSHAFLLEGIDDRSEAFMNASDRVEARINGPFSREISKGYFQLAVDINVLVNSRMDGQRKNAYTHDEILGLYHEALDGVIAIYRYGTGPDDDQLLLGCLSSRSGKNDAIRVIQFGQIDRTDRLRQGMVDARYLMYLEDN